MTAKPKLTVLARADLKRRIILERDLVHDGREEEQRPDDEIPATRHRRHGDDRGGAAAAKSRASFVAQMPHLASSDGGVDFGPLGTG
jgi:hypothetical protein